MVAASEIVNRFLAAIHIRQDKSSGLDMYATAQTELRKRAILKYSLAPIHAGDLDLNLKEPTR